jgi:hypothetical protein
MRAVLFSILALAYFVTLLARWDRAAWIATPVAFDWLLFCLPAAGLAVLAKLGSRRLRPSKQDGLVYLAIVSAILCLVLALYPSIQ